MSKSQIVLIALIAGVLWMSKDYLADKKDLVITKVDQVQASTQKPQTTPALKEFEN